MADIDNPPDTSVRPARSALAGQRTRRNESEPSLRRFLERAAAARSLAGGAAVAMAGDANRPAFELDVEQLGQVDALARDVSACERQIEHLVEVAVVDVALPIDRD